jgi:hypothetical protein
MTVQRRKARPSDDDPDDGGFVEVHQGKGTYTFRTSLLILVLSATPFGQQFLKGFGIHSPAGQEVNDVQRVVDSIRKDIAEVKADVAGVKNDVSVLKSEVSEVTRQNNRLASEFTGFRVDFDKYKKEDSKCE